MIKLKNMSKSTTKQYDQLLTDIPVVVTGRIIPQTFYFQRLWFYVVVSDFQFFVEILIGKLIQILILISCEMANLDDKQLDL